MTVSCDLLILMDMSVSLYDGPPLSPPAPLVVGDERTPYTGEEGLRPELWAKAQ